MYRRNVGAFEQLLRTRRDECEMDYPKMVGWLVKKSADKHHLMNESRHAASREEKLLPKAATIVTHRNHCGPAVLNRSKFATFVAVMSKLETGPLQTREIYIRLLATCIPISAGV